MILLFRRTRVFAILASLLWAAAVAVGRVFVFNEFESTVSGIVSPVVCLLCGVYIAYSFASREARKTHRAYTELLSRDCDPERFLSLYESVWEAGKTKKGLRYLVDTTYATGLHLAGRTEEALPIVRALTESPEFARCRAVDRADAYVDVGIYSLSLGDLEAVAGALDASEGLLREMAVGSAEYNRIYRECERLRHRREIVTSFRRETSPHSGVRAMCWFPLRSGFQRQILLL